MKKSDVTNIIKEEIQKIMNESSVTEDRMLRSLHDKLNALNTFKAGPISGDSFKFEVSNRVNTTTNIHGTIQTKSGKVYIHFDEIIVPGITYDVTYSKSDTSLSKDSVFERVFKLISNYRNSINSVTWSSNKTITENNK